jgi:hypothetical protein
MADQKNGTGNNKEVSGKRDWSLIPWGPLEEVVAVFEHGAEKYGVNDWQKDVNRSVYWSALFRHAKSWFIGERIDPKSGLNHMAHVVANALILIWKDDYDSRIRKSNDTL